MSFSANVHSSDRVKPTRGFTSARIVALVLIAGALVGLAALRFAPGPEPVSVPPGARAGDLTMGPCIYATENGGYSADCGTLVVPENRADPSSRLIALPVTRIRARSGHPAEPIFHLEGGPGETNMAFPQASRYVENHDLVLVGYRGLDGSVRLDCPEVESALAHSADFLAEGSFRAYGDAFRSCADRLTRSGVNLSAYGLAQQVDDLDAARTALGYGRIDLLSESAGTRTAMIYAWRYPQSIYRSVMIGANPPGHFLYDPRTTDEQVGRYAELCAADPSCSKRTADLAASIRRTSTDMPGRWLFLPIKQGNVKVVSFIGLMQPTSQASAVLDAWLSAAEGDPSGFWFASVLGNLMFPKIFVWGQYAAAAARIDAQTSRDYFSSSGQQPDSNLGYAVTAYAWGGGRFADAWPVAPDEADYRQVRTSDVETLLVGGQIDISTPPSVATKELLPYLPNGHEVVLPGFAHTPSIRSEQPEAGTRLITTFFDSGRVDVSLYKPQTVDFTPQVTATALAKVVAGAMFGLALLTVLSLLWMARRVRDRGGFGRKASAALRSLYPLVLGPGGWFLGALAVMTVLPTVPLDDKLLVVLSVGVPVGLGIYWAWVSRNLAPRSRTIGFSAAIGAALLGAWLGFNATVGPLAIVTTIVGAIIGANLALIVLDISRDRSVRYLTTATNVVETETAA